MNFNFKAAGWVLIFAFFVMFIAFSVTGWHYMLHLTCFGDFCWGMLGWGMALGFGAMSVVLIKWECGD